MKNKDRKIFQKKLAEENIEILFSFLDKRFMPKYDTLYIKEIQRLSEGFNIRLKREQKLKFCKKCHCYWNINTREIRFNSAHNTKEYICKQCSFVKRFKYQKLPISK